MDSPAAPTPPPEASLIRLARDTKNISPETAAGRMPFQFSGSSWRQIEAGYRGRARKEVKGKAAVVAQMARVVGVSAERLAEAGREDAAEVLREIELQEAEQAERAQQGVMTEAQMRARMAEITQQLLQPSSKKIEERLMDEGERLMRDLNRLRREREERPDETPDHRRAG